MKSLIYEQFSGVGLCNQLFSFETAIYLANITNRKLILLIKNQICHAGRAKWDYGYFLNYFTNDFLEYLPNGFEVYYKDIPDMVKEILNNHKKEKGMIHTHSTKVAEHLKRTIRNKRIIVAYGANREESLQKHIKSKEPTVLISPSMAEGVDLKGNLSNFQVICKVPFPYLGDKAVVKKMNRWKWWYNTQTVRTIIQAVGRSIRSENDTAVTYILDGDWNRIKSSCRDYFPENFFENYHEM